MCTIISKLVISGGIFRFGHDQVVTRIACGENLISSPLLFFFIFCFSSLLPLSTVIQRVIATELNSSLKMLVSPSMGMLRVSLILVACGHRSDRGCVSIANGLCIIFCNVEFHCIFLRSCLGETSR